ncbi:MAG: SurA N-terminal domain-containing protein [Vitreimonas sp.]
MLLQFRKLTRGAIASIILGLVGLAMVIFLVPNTDLGQLGGSAHLAEVGGRKITPLQLSRELDLTLQAQRNNGQMVTQQEAIDAGLHRRLLESMIGRNALYAYSRKLGVSASDTQVANYIREIPSVMNPVTGSFDQTAYAQFLDTMRYTQSEFEGDVRNDLSTQLVMSALVNGVRAPSSFGALLYAYQGETRVVSVAAAPASAVGAVAPPTEEQVQALWQESQEQLRVPEFRALTLVFARPADFVGRVNVPEAQLREAFEARRASLTTPERRSYVRISAQSQAQANDAAARLTRGEAPEAVATALSLQLTRGADQARTEVPDRRVAEAVFTQARGAVRAVQGQLTPWVVVRVDSITPGSEPSFEAQREELRLAIATEEAGGLLNTAIGAFDDARGAGASVADAARQAGLPTVTVAEVEEGGRDRSGAPVAALADHEDLLRIAFDTPEGEASDFLPAGDADVVVAVDRVTAASVRPLAEVREQLSQLWVARERVRRMRELGAEVIEAVRGGQSFAAAARAHGFTLGNRSQTLNRQAASQIPSRGLPTQIFAAAQGDVVADMHASGGALLVAHVEQINRADPASAPQVVEAARAQLEQSVTESLGAAARDEIVARANPRRNNELLERSYPSSTADDAQAQ